MTTADDFIVRFWGVRGSYPAVGSACTRYGGNTPCVEVQAGGALLILDGGSGLIPLGRSLAQTCIQGKPLEAVILFSHLHHDHLQGFPFFSPAYLPTTRLHLIGPEFLGVSVRQWLETTMRPPFFPVELADLKAAIHIETLRESGRLYLGEAAGGLILNRTPDPDLERHPDILKVRALHAFAHPNGIYCYRIEWRGRSVVYATDTESYPGGNRRLAAFAHDCDVLIHDAQYQEDHYLGERPDTPTTQGYGHSTASMACETARLANAHQLILFHHAPEYDDDQLDAMQNSARHLFADTLSAYEGLSLDLSKPAVTEQVYALLNT